MQKAVAALEKNVEWIALGLAGIWVLWVVWSFVISKPVYVEVEGQKLSAADVDKEIAREAAEPLRAKVADSGPAPTIIVPPIQLAWDVKPPPPLTAPPIFSDIVVEVKPEDQLPIDPRFPNAPRRLASGEKAAQLPEIPKPVIVEVVADKGQVIPPVIQQPDMLQPGQEGNFPVQPLLPPQPAQPQIGPEGALVQNVNARDEWWVWITAKFNEAAVQAAFQEAKFPPQFSRMEYLAVEVQREELLPDGTWGNATLVPPLKHNAPPTEADRQRNPIQYLEWALRPENQLIILEPPFYQTVGTRKIPLHLQPRVQTIAENALPIDMTNMDMMALAQQMETMLPIQVKQIEDKLTGDQKRQLYQARQELAREKQRMEAEQRRSQYESQRQQRRGSRGFGGSSGGRSYAPIDPELMGEMLASGSAPPGRGGYFPGRDRYIRGSGGAGLPMINPVMPTPVDPTQLNVVRPGGIIDQNGRISFGEFDLWAYDDTVEPGKTYRYRMRVVLKNPVYRLGNAVQDPKIAEILELPPEKDKGWSDWSRPIVVERAVEMFLAGTGRDTVRFDVYRWQDGKINKRQVAAGPGDMVGGVDANSKIDFSTGLAVVDIRQVGQRDWRVTLLDSANGTQVVRTFQADLGDPRRTALEAELNKPANPALSDVR